MKRMVYVEYLSKSLDQQLRRNILSYRKWTDRLSQETYPQLKERCVQEIIEVKARIDEDIYLLQLMGFGMLIKETCLEMKYPVPDLEPELTRNANAHTQIYN